MEWILGALAALLAFACAWTENRRRSDKRAHRLATARAMLYRQAFVEVLQGDFTEIDDVLRRLLNCLRDTIAVERVSLWLFEDGRNAIVRRALVQRQADKPSGPSRLERKTHPRYFDAVGQEFVVAADDAHVDLRTAEFESDYLRPLNIGAMLDVPIRTFGRHAGLLCVEHLGGPRMWTREDQVFAAAVATQVAFAFERAAHESTREALMRRTLRDPTTSLPNGVMLRDQLQVELQASNTCALLAICVPQVRLIETTRGHAYCEILMQRMAERLAPLADETRLLARTARDEFALLMPGETSSRAVEGWALRIRNAAAEPIDIDGDRLRLTLNVGYSVAGGSDQLSADRLMIEAAAALREAESSGHQGFDPSERNRAQQRMDIEQALRKALAEGGFESWLQPVVDIEGPRIVAFESLLRWRYAGDVLAPARFLNEAVGSGLIVPIGRIALNAAMENYRELCRRVPGLQARLAINLSAPELMNADLERHFVQTLDRCGIAPEQVTIEVTETALVSDLDRAQRTLDHLRASGIRICLDDFGTGFSSLIWLKRFPITEIKIEGSFVRGIGTDPRDGAIVESIVSLAAKLGQHVVAEGVENHQQLKHLRNMGVRFMQGYYFSPPAASESFTEAHIATILARVPSNGEGP